VALEGLDRCCDRFETNYPPEQSAQLTIIILTNERASSLPLVTELFSYPHLHK
jgi:hypothetical protein